MAVLLVAGIMDLGAMTLIAAAITVERVVPAGARAARAVGVIVAAAGVWLIARAVAVAS